jgi:hypothetical protein
MKRVKDIERQHEVLGAAYLLSGLVLDTSKSAKLYGGMLCESQ